jgi:hypothetical protein
LVQCYQCLIMRSLVDGEETFNRLDGHLCACRRVYLTGRLISSEDYIPPSAALPHRYAHNPTYPPNQTGERLYRSIPSHRVRLITNRFNSYVVRSR